MKNFSLIFFITLLFFLIFNLLIVLTWPIYSKFNSQKHSYIEPQIELLNLSNKDLIILNNEMWKNYDKFRFVPFIGHSETNRSGKFLNFKDAYISAREHILSGRTFEHLKGIQNG